MQEHFEHRQLLTPEALRALLVKHDAASGWRLAVHLGVLLLAAVAAIHWHDSPLLALPATVLLAVAWAGVFAPFHECTHQTAFATPRYNALGAWLTGLPFGMAPSVYRTFHFEHHRHTQDLSRDPEALAYPGGPQWPRSGAAWRRAALGDGLMRLKLSLALHFALRPRHEWPLLGRWTDYIEDPAGLARECRLLLAAWAAFLLAALLWIPGGVWLLAGLWLAHVLQTLWLMCEHSSLPTTGSILLRTRSVTSNGFARFWLWNMNYHAEHHAWPGIPWHRLPDAHRTLGPHLPALAPGYIAQHASVLAGHPLATPAG